MVRVAKKEKEAAEKHLKASLPKKKASLTHEQQQSARLVSVSFRAGLSASVCRYGQQLATSAVALRCFPGTGNLESSDS